MQLYGQPEDGVTACEWRLENAERHDREGLHLSLPVLSLQEIKSRACIGEGDICYELYEWPGER